MMLKYSLILFFQTTTANFSLFPLLYREQETCVKVFLHLFYTMSCFYYHLNNGVAFGRHALGARRDGSLTLKRHKKYAQATKAEGVSKCYLNISNLTWAETLYLLISVTVFIFPYLLDALIDASLRPKVAFLPLLLYSVYCSCGNMYAFYALYRHYMISGV